MLVLQQDCAVELPTESQDNIGDTERSAMTQLFNLNTSFQHDPAIAVWSKRHAGELGDCARYWFAVMRQCGDDVREVLHDGYPTVCIGKVPFAYVGVFKAHVNVGFFQGNALDDPAGLLQGSGKYMRHVKLRNAGDGDAAALHQLIDAAYHDMQRRLQHASG